MRHYSKKPRIAWYYALIFLFLFLEAVFLYALGENIYASAHDNLDLHIADYHILSLTDSFFSHQTALPLLDGINRDYFFSEFSLYSLLYMLLPTGTAYITGYLLKTVIALVSCLLLGRELLKERFREYEPLVALAGFAYGILPLYPAFSFAFVSLPLVILLLVRICRKPRPYLYVLLFLYPLLSYFTFIGFFILCYLLAVFLFLAVRWLLSLRRASLKKSRPGPVLSLFLALIVLSAGYIVWEYRLFYVMLFDSVPTIRDTMVQGSYSFGQIVSAIFQTFTSGVFHADAVHSFFLLPVCLLYLVLLNLRYLKARDFKGMRKDLFNRILALILLNCVVYGLYYQEGLRRLIETLLPPLKGFQLTRTVFFNPFLWYLALFVILKRLYDKNKKRTAHGLALVSIGVILLTGSKYNDLYNTCFNYAYRFLKQTPSNSLTYKEFYSEALFQAIKEDIHYAEAGVDGEAGMETNAALDADPQAGMTPDADGPFVVEKAVAYGMHPAVLEYNGIYTLDGCLSYYPQEYKEAFRRIIAPALDRVESFRVYYDDWGARAYLFAGVDENVYEPVRNLTISDPNLYIDADALREMGGKYIFSRLPVANADALELTLRGVYTHPDSPYTIYLYDTGLLPSQACVDGTADCFKHVQ